MRDRPLRRLNDLKLALRYANEIGLKMPDSPAGKWAIAVQPLLKELRSSDVPIDFKDPNVPDNRKTDFGFLHHGKLNKSALITLKPNSCVTFNPFQIGRKHSDLESNQRDFAKYISSCFCYKPLWRRPPRWSPLFRTADKPNSLLQ